MPTRYFWIIIVLAAAWQIVGAVIQRANRKQKEERMRELAVQRERQLRTRAGAPPAVTARPVDDLAARRRAQLEELRQRRAGRPEPGLQARPGTPTLTPSPLTPARVPPQLRTPPPRGPIVQRQPRPAPPPRRPPQAAPQARPKAPPIVARPVRPPEMAPAEPPPGAFEPAPPRVAGAKPAEAAPGRRRITRQDLSPQSLRKLILLREILDPPVSLRDEEVWQRM